MVDALLLIKCGDGFGPDLFPPCGPDHAIADVGVLMPDDGLDHLAAIVALPDDPVGFPLAVELNRTLSPAVWGIDAARVLEHVEVIGVSCQLPGHNNAGFVGVRV